MTHAFVRTQDLKSASLGYFLSGLQILGASLLLACLAQISIPLYFSPVPLTGQTFGVMLIGASLGSRKGALAVLAYLMEGALGLPFFAGGGFGILPFIARGGYLLGFVLQAYLVGWYVERQQSFSSLKTLGVLLLSAFVQMSAGVLWLSSLIGFSSAVMLGFYPFVIGEVLKATGLTAYLRK